MDHFGPGIELLDINTDDEARVVNFTCFTEKVQKRGTVSNEGNDTASFSFERTWAD
jgi:cell cycle checkpoint control protein RAD9A